MAANMTECIQMDCVNEWEWRQGERQWNNRKQANDNSNEDMDFKDDFMVWKGFEWKGFDQSKGLYKIDFGWKKGFGQKSKLLKPFSMFLEWA